MTHRTQDRCAVCHCRTGCGYGVPNCPWAVKPMYDLPKESPVTDSRVTDKRLPVRKDRSGQVVIGLPDGGNLVVTKLTALRLSADLEDVTRDTPTGHTRHCMPELGPDYCSGHE